MRAKCTCGHDVDWHSRGGMCTCSTCECRNYTDAEAATLRVEVRANDEYLHEVNAALGAYGVLITDGALDGVRTLGNERDELRARVAALEALQALAGWRS